MQTTKKHISTIAVCLVTTLLLSVFPNVNVKAASYSGSGTMADPYLVQTAEQLQGIRDNLSAHYKLANTIDLSGKDFKPIGRLDAPFTGSFVCELNADLTPKYVIKNLSITVAESAYAAQNKNKWEAALFGATNGATFSGIYVLDAKITNKNYGDNTGGVAYGNYKPGMDEMNSAILIGQANTTTVMNCGTTGTINTRSSWCGGLIGRALNSVVENCYSTANVITEAQYRVGGLIGGGDNLTVTASFATGNVKGGNRSIGSFIGGVTGITATDCYATGNASGGERRSVFVTQCDGSSNVFKNCYASGKLDATPEAEEGTVNANNCWVLSGTIHNMKGFKEGSMAQIKSALASSSNWDTSGSQPKLKTMGVVTDASKYVPGAVEQAPEASGNTTDTSGTQDSQGSTVADGTTTNTTTVTPEEVKALIEALPNPDEENAITIKEKEQVIEAWKAYEALSAGDKDEFDATLSGKLANVRFKMSVLVAGELVKALNELPEVEDLTADNVEQILELWEDYQFLDETVLAELDADVKEKMEAAYEYAQENQQGSAQNTVLEVDTGLTTVEKVIMIVCGVVIVFAVAFDIFAGVYFIKTKRKEKQQGVKVNGKTAED